jgi:hypothetical protein
MKYSITTTTTTIIDLEAAEPTKTANSILLGNMIIMMENQLLVTGSYQEGH